MRLLRSALVFLSLLQVGCKNDAQDRKSEEGTYGQGVAGLNATTPDQKPLDDQTSQPTQGQEDPSLSTENSPSNESVTPTDSTASTDNNGAAEGNRPVLGLPMPGDGDQDPANSAPPQQGSQDENEDEVEGEEQQAQVSQPPVDLPNTPPQTSEQSADVEIILEEDSSDLGSLAGRPLTTTGTSSSTNMNTNTNTNASASASATAQPLPANQTSTSNPTTPGLRSTIPSGFALLGAAFTVRTTQVQAGDSPVQRLRASQFNAEAELLLASSSEADFAVQSLGFELLGRAFYSIDEQGSEQGVPVYRLYRQANGDLFYTADRTEALRKARESSTAGGTQPGGSVSGLGYRNEGVSFSALCRGDCQMQRGGRVVYTYWNEQTETHVYSFVKM